MLICYKCPYCLQQTDGKYPTLLSFDTNGINYHVICTNCLQGCEVCLEQSEYLESPRLTELELEKVYLN